MQLLRPSPILVLSSLLALAASQEEQAWPILNAHFAIPEANVNDSKQAKRKKNAVKLL